MIEEILHLHHAQNVRSAGRHRDGLVGLILCRNLDVKSRVGIYLLKVHDEINVLRLARRVDQTYVKVVAGIGYVQHCLRRQRGLYRIDRHHYVLSGCLQHGTQDDE